MKFIIATQEFNYLVSKCFSVVSSKAPSPILGNILIEAVNGELILTATDLIVAIRCRTEAKILEEGATCLPAKRLASLLKELTSVNLEISSSPTHLTEIFADASKFKLLGMGVNEFPTWPSLEASTRINLKQSDLKETLYRTSFAVSHEDSRFTLTGVFLQINEGKATFVGTDGKRLARSQLPVNIDPSFTGSYILPIKSVDEFQKNLLDEDEATLYLSQEKIGLETSNITIISKLLSGEYPDFQRIIPERSDIVISLHRDELMTLLRQVSLFTFDATHSVRLTFQEGELFLSANSIEIGEGKVSMPAQYHGPRLDIAFNPQFFIDILRHSKNETVKLGLNDAYNPGLIADNEEFVSSSTTANPLFILMPMRLNEV